MTSHPWLSPLPSLVAGVRRTQAANLLRRLSGVTPKQLGARAEAWPPFLAALPAMLRTDSERVLDVVGRVDVFSPLLELTIGPVDALRLERALVAVWLGLAGHPGLAAPLALPGPFRVQVVDPRAPRLLAFAGIRGLVATARGLVVVGRTGHLPLETLVADQLPAVDGAVIVDERCGRPDDTVVARVRAVLDTVRCALPGGRLERVTIGAGDAAYGEARVDADVDPADLVASAQAGFVRAAATLEPVLNAGGAVVEHGRRVAPLNVLARACGNAVALPWRADRAAAASGVVNDLDDLAVLADLTPAGAELVVALRGRAGTASGNLRHALLVNVDPDDFVYSFQFGRSVERRCVERQLRVDRLAINPTAGHDLAAELGRPVPLPLADGIEILIDSDKDQCLAAALRRVASRRYEVIVLNVRASVFFDLLTAGLLATPTLVWDRHLHGGLRQESARRGLAAGHLRGLPIQAWSLDRRTGPGLQPSLAAAGFEHGSGHVWPLDLEFFRSNQISQPACLFAGGDNQRDWELFIAAVQGVPFDVHMVTAHAPADLPRHVRVDARLPLWRFREAMASAAVAAVPLAPNAAAGVTVIPMAMALGVAVVATRTPWTEPLILDGETGLLVPAGDAGAFRAALLRLYEQPELRVRLIANARERVTSLCDLEAFTRGMFETLD